MTEEREIVGFVLPLTAGIAVCTIITNNILRALTGFFILPPLILATAAGYRHRKETGTAAARTAAIAFLLGIFIMNNSAMCLPSRAPEIPSGRNPFENTAAHVRTAINGIPFSEERTPGLLRALITGDKSGLDKKVRENFTESGAAHLLALSGLHLGIIYLIIQKILAVLGRSIAARWARFILVLLCTSWYTLATGASPSLTRAFLFIFLSETARITARPQNSGQILMAALTIQLLLSPEELLSTGFQLSYLAVTGIVYIYPRLKKCWPGGHDADKSWMGWMWNSACLSIACQMTTAPLAWFRFGALPSWFLIANLIAIPLTGILIPASIMTTLLNAAGICPDVLVRTTECLADLLLEAVRLISLM